jgi:hypothetical protein
MSETIETALVPFRGDTQAALRHALRLWAEASTAPSTERREEIQGYKQKVVSSFFSFVGKRPGEVSTHHLHIGLGMTMCDPELVVSTEQARSRLTTLTFHYPSQPSLMKSRIRN